MEVSHARSQSLVEKVVTLRLRPPGPARLKAPLPLQIRATSIFPLALFITLQLLYTYSHIVDLRLLAALDAWRAEELSRALSRARTPFTPALHF